MRCGIELEVVWWDQHLIELSVRCSNGSFSGQANIDLGHDGLSKMAEALRGFPSAAADSRSLELGTFNPDHGDGGIRMYFSCRDSVGHAAVDVKLRGDGCRNLGEVESVALRIPVEAAGIDFFLTQVQSMNTEEIGATACLHMAS